MGDVHCLPVYVIYLVSTMKHTGTVLLELCQHLSGGSKTNLVIEAGYVKPNGQLDFIGFYEALLQAKGLDRRFK